MPKRRSQASIDRHERRRRRREQVQAEKNARALVPRSSSPRLTFNWRFRKGDAVTLDFQFGGTPVPYEDPDDPTIEERARKARVEAEKALLKMETDKTVH